MYFFLFHKTGCISAIQVNLIAFDLHCFCLDTKEKVPKRKNQDCIFLTTTVLRSAKEKELATLKQLFLFNVTLHTYA